MSLSKTSTVFVLSLIVTAAVVGYAFVGSAQSTALHSQVSTSTITSIVPTGISLLVSTNGTIISEGEHVAVTATIFNTLGQHNDIQTKYAWPFAGLSMFDQRWAPCYYYSPIEFVVLRGNYSSSQIAQMGSGGIPSQFCYESENVTELSFLPSSDLVNITAVYSVDSKVSTSGPISVSLTVTTDGYWDYGSYSSYTASYTSMGEYGFLPAQHAFVRGTYTVAVADEWGQLDVIHLSVK